MYEIILILILRESDFWFKLIWSKLYELNYLESSIISKIGHEKKPLLTFIVNSDLRTMHIGIFIDSVVLYN